MRFCEDGLGSCPLRRLSGAAPDATTNKAGRTRRGTYRMFPRETHTTQPRSPNTACWRFLGRQGRLHPPDSLLLRFRSELTLREFAIEQQSAGVSGNGALSVFAAARIEENRIIQVGRRRGRDEKLVNQIFFVSNVPRQ